jgi:hypothetical protein
LLLLAALLSGCITNHRASAPAADYYYLNPNKSLTTIGRVAIVDLDNNSSYPKVSTDVTEKLYQALQKNTEFRPYPHMTIGLRLKLIDLRDGQLLWAIEQVWDSADKTTEYRIRDYFRSQKRSGYAPLHEQLAAVSPIEFIKFVSYEVAETL